MTDSGWRRGLVAGAFVLVSLLGLAACGDDEPAGPEPVAESSKRIVRARAAALFSEERFPEALRAMAPLLEGPEPAGEDLVRAGVAEMWIGAPDSYRKALALLERALALTPDDPAVHYNLAKLYEQSQGQTERALAHMRKAHELAPDDLPTSLALAGLLEQADLRDEAVALYVHLKDDVGIENAGSWHLITLYQLAQIRIRQGKREEGQRLLTERATLLSQGVTMPSADQTARGNLGALQPPPPGGGALPTPAAPALAVEDGPAGLAGYEHVRAVTLFDDWRHVEEGCEVHPPDVVAWGKKGLVVARTEDGKEYAVETLDERPIVGVAALDLNNDRAIDFVVASTVGMTVLMAEEGGVAWKPAAFAFPSVPTPPTDMEPVDYDHDGDIDLLLVGAWGARLWRNDGVVETGGRLTDASKETGMPAGRELRWCQVEDMDTDQDVDLLFGDEGATTWLYDNERGGRFRDASDRTKDLGSQAMRWHVADFDGDGRPDLYVPGELWLGKPGGRFVEAEGPELRDFEARHRGDVLDWDLDGAADTVWTDWGGDVAGALALGRAHQAWFRTPAARAKKSRTEAAHADFDGDGLPDRLASLEGGSRFVRTRRGANRGFLLALRGVKSNARGVGAVVEIRAGPIYRRIFWTGEPQLIGLGTQEKADITRITWPNGVIQHDLDTPAGCMRLIEQAEGLVGSCPFLYTWNGEKYEFISDVLGITPMGLPMAPGMLVPPDHDEYVRVRGEQMKPRKLEDGSWVYEMQFTEELREVTYLDRARLLVVDHPAGTEMYPTERFSFPPFPQHHVNVVKPIAPEKVVGSDGKDWTQDLAAVDGSYASPFTPRHGQFLGLANPHWLELHFDPALVGSAKQLRMLFTGWFFWTDASVNMASARTPGVDFVPPILQVPDGKGGWKDAGPPVGFPAGKTKTMVLDVSAILDPADPRIRVFSTLRLYWDSIRLAAGGDHESSTTAIEASSAWLWERGFSKPIPTGGEHALDWFDWDVTAAPRWNQHPGLYTKHGEVLPLLERVDDQFVILGSGDALRLRFDASRAQPLKAGWRRDFLVFLDGWAKDRDPNTHDALFVEPLPFHGMKGYPYPPDQHYPDTPEHRRYRDTWNIRPSKTWIPSLVPSR